jgi:hypothetical protein
MVNLNIRDNGGVELMGKQVIKQPTPEGKEQLYAVWSSEVDSIVLWDATERDIYEYFRQEALERFERNHEIRMKDVETDRWKGSTFSLTWEEAKAKTEERYGTLEGEEVRF